MRILLFLCLLCTFNAHAAETPPAPLNETVAGIDVAVKDLYGKEETGKVTITEFKPDGDGPFPILILNHGRGMDRSTPGRVRNTPEVKFFLARGFAVFVPTRIGYGDNGIAFDPEESGPCKSKDYRPMIEAQRVEEFAVIDYAKRQPDVDPHRLVIAGQSVGGIMAISMGAVDPEGLVGVINISGGAGGNPVAHPGVACHSELLESLYAQFGRTSRVPTLWIYAENDLFFGPTYSKAWYDAFTKAGGKGQFEMLPPFGKNGHMLYGQGMQIWTPIVSAFLDQLGFSKKG